MKSFLPKKLYQLPLSGLFFILFFQTAFCEVIPPPPCTDLTRQLSNAKSNNTDIWDDIGVVMDLLNSGNISWIFESGATFQENANGTATLTGVIHQFGFTNRKLQVNIALSGRTWTPPAGSPFNQTGVSSSDWYYYPNWSGTFTGQGDLAGGNVNFTTHMNLPFQFGTGANQIWSATDMVANGGGAWFEWSIVSQPTNTNLSFKNYVSGASTDINVLLSGTPTVPCTTGGDPCNPDTTPPVISGCPSNQTLTTSSTCSNANWTAPTASDNCSTPTLSSNYNSGYCFPVGTTTVIYTATNAAGLTSTCSFTIAVNPSACNNVTSGGTIVSNQSICAGTQPAPITNITYPSGGSGNIEYIWLASTTGCPSSLTLTIPGANAESFQPGILTQTTYYRRCARRAGCTGWVGESNCITITVTQDNTPPVISGCPSNQSLNTSSSCVAASWAAPMATDNCGTPTLTSNFSSGYCFPVGTTTVVYTATNAAGLTATCSFTVSVTASTSGCDNISIVPSANTITVGGLTSPITMVQVFSSTWATAFSCSGNCNAPTQVISNLSPGIYYVKVTLLTASWQQICIKEIYVTVPGGTACDNVTSGGSIAADQTSNCGPFDPAPLTSVTPASGGSGTLEYIWLSSTSACPNSTAQIIAGATSESYDPPTVSQTTYFRRCARRAGCQTYLGESNCIIITVNNDNTPPVIAGCPTNQSLTTSTACAIANWTAPTATDNCGTPTLASNYNSGFCFPLGTTTVMYTATNAAGLTATCTFTITVTNACNNVTSGGSIAADQTSNCGPFDPAPLTSITPASGGTGTLEYIWLSSTSACPNSTAQIIAGANGESYDPPTVSQTTYFRRCARRAGCQTYLGESNCITITVNNDNTPPVIAGCPANQSLTTSTACAAATWTAPTATDNCGTPTLASNFSSGYCFPLGTTTVTYTATNAAGLTATCTFTVTVTNACNNVTSGGSIAADQTSNCGPFDPAPLTSITPASGGTGTLEYIWLSSTSACPNSTAQIIAGANGESYDPPTVSQTTYFRRCARRAGCQTYLGESNCITITVNNDNTPPVIAGCPANQSLTTSTACAAATWTAPTATDNCGTPTLASNFSSGYCFPLGTTTVTYTATNAAGLTATCTFTVTVTNACNNVTSGGSIAADQTSNCGPFDPAPLTSITPASGGTGTLEYIWLSSTSACPNSTAQIIAGANGESYDPPTVSQTTYFRRCARRAGCQTYLGESNCITITVNNDNTPPVIAGCPANQSLTTSTACAAATWTAPTATDNCGTPTLASNFSSGYCFPLGTTTVTYTATNAAGLTATCTFTVTVTNACNNVTSGGSIAADQTSNCGPFDPAPLTSITPASGGTGTLEYIWLSSTSACPNSTAQIIAGANGESYDPPTVSQTTYFRRCARRAGCQTYLGESNCITITVNNDNTPPVIAGCPANQSLTTSTACAAATWTAPTATDNCGVPTLSSNFNSGYCFPLGTTTVMYTATNAAGLTATCTFTIIVTNACNNVTSGGTIAANQTSNCGPFVPAPLTNVTYPTGGTGTIEYLWLVSTTSCPTSLTQTIPGANLESYQPGLLTQTTYYRRCARRAGCTQWLGESNCITITVNNDNTPPVIAGCPANQSLTTSTACAVAAWTAPTATDNCGVPTLSSNFNSGYCFPLGTTTVMYTATNAAGLTATCTFTITVTNACDNVTSGGTIAANQTSNCGPFVPAPLTNVTYPTGGTGTIEYLWLVSTTSCPTSLTQTIPGANLESYQPGLLTQTTYYRRCARRAGCTQWLGESNCITITVNNDNTPPVIAGCPANQSLTTSTACAVAAWTAPTATDNCGVPTLSSNFNSGYCFPLGTTTVMYTATNAAGLTATCTFTIIVTNACNNVTSGGTIAANQTSNCGPFDPAPLTNVTPASGGSGTLEYIWLSSTTACPNSTAQIIAGANGESYDPPTVSQTTYFRRCARRAGCQTYLGESNCITITVNNDNTPPVIAGCPTNQSLTTSTTCAVATWTAPTATDNCGTPTLTSNYNSGYCFPLGTTTVMYTATNAAGLTATCTFTIIVTNACNNVTSGGTIAANQTSNCGPFDPAPLTNVTPASGGSGTLEYIWLSSTTACPNSTAQIIAGANGESYDPPTVSQTTYFRRCARRAGCQTYLGESNCITITVNNDNTPPVIAGCPTNQSLTTSTTCAVATWTAPTATDNCGTPTLTSNYNSGYCFPLGTTTVMYTATNAAGLTATCTFTISVSQPTTCNNVTNGGTIGKTCSNGSISLTSVTSPSGGSGTIEYVWMKGTSNCTISSMTAVPNSNSSTLTVASPSVSTYYIRCSRRAGCTTYPGESNCITVTANECSSAGCSGNVLFVSNSTTLNSADAAVKNRLITLGYTVTVMDHITVATSNATGKVLVVISESVSSSSVNTKFRDVTVPVMTLEPYLYDDMKMTGLVSGTDYGYSTITSMYVNSGHPISTGVSGNTTVYTTSQNAGWGKPSSQAAIIAYNNSNSSYKHLFAYETGTSMVGMNAPARRVGFFLYGSCSPFLTANGWKLFDNAVKWSAGCPISGQQLQAEITISDFSAAPEFRKTRIEWASNTGYRNDYVVVERLNEENATFEAIDYIETSTTDNAAHVFTTYDAEPLEGDNFYRLKLIFSDGSEEYSEVKKVNFDGIEKIHFFPNPANETVTIDILPYQGKNVTIFMYDQMGRVLQEYNVPDVFESMFHINVANLSGGNYFFRVVTDGKRDVTKQISIQH